MSILVLGELINTPVLFHESTTSIIGNETTTARTTPQSTYFRATVTPTAGNHVIDYKIMLAFS